MANTTNLDLVKPAGTDKALVSVINANSDKIDAFAGTTNQALSKVDTAHNFGQYTSLDTFKSDLLTFMQNVASFKTVAIQFVFTQTVEPFVAWSTFSGYAHCIQNGSTSLYFSCDVASNNGEDISIGYSNGTWNINKLALNSNLKSSTIRQIDGSNDYVLIKDGVDFIDYRNPIFGWYADQTCTNFIVFILFRSSNSFTFHKLYGTNIDSTGVEISGNDIKISGFGNWGKGISIGRRE